MSESPEKTPAPESPEPAKPAKSIGRWRKRFRRRVIVLIILAIVFRVVLFFAIGPVLHRVGRSLGFDITFDRQELTLLGGDVGLWYLKVVPLSGGEPVFQADYIRGSIAPFELLKGRLLIRRAEADGVKVVLERNEAGRFPLLDQFVSAPTTSPARPQSTRPKPPIELDFSSPLLVEAFRMQQVRATIIDKAVKPEVRATISLDARISELGFKGRPARFDVDVWCDPALDSLRVSGNLVGEGRHLSADARVFMRGLHLKPLTPYLALLGIKPIANDLSMDLRMKLDTDPLPAPSKAVKAMLVLEGISFIADQTPVASLSRVLVQADSADPTAVTIGQIQIEGGRAEATRTSKGLLRVAGLEFGGSTPTSQAIKPPAPPPTTSLSPQLLPYTIIVREIILKDLAAVLADQAVSPANDLGVRLVELSSKGQDINPNNPDSIIPLTGSIEIPGIIQNVHIDAQAKPFGRKKTLDASFVADQIKPMALVPYLADLGIESMLQSARAEGKLAASIQMDDSGGVTADARISGVKLTDGADLFAMQDVNIKGAGIDPRTGRIRVESIELNGPTLDVTLDPEGRLVIANLRYSPPPSRPQQPKSVPPTGVPMAVPVLPRIELGHFAWQGAKLGLHNQQMSPVSNVAIDNAGADVSNLVIDLASTETGKPSTVRFWLASPEIAKELRAGGTVTAGPKSLAAQIAVRGSGIQSAQLAPYAKPFGFSPTLHDGSVQVDAKLSLTQLDDGFSATLGLTDVKLNDGTQELAGLDALQVDNLAITSAGLDVKSIHITKPRIEVARETDGAFAAAGIRIPKPTTQSKTAETKPQTAPTLQPSINIALHEFRVDDAQLGWTDLAMPAPVRVVAHADLQLGAPTGPKNIDFRTIFKVDGMLDEMVIAGSASLVPEALSAKLQIDGRGIRSGSAAAYLPPGLEISTHDGRLRTTIEASLNQVAAGGNSVRLIVNDVDWREAQESNPLFAMESLRVLASRIDMPQDVIAFDEIFVSGLQVEAQTAPGGVTKAIGLTVRPVKAAAAETAAPTTASQEELNARMAELRKPLPLLTVEKLDIGIKRAGFRDLNRPESAVVALEDFHLKNSEPLRLGGPDAATQAPAKIEMTGKISPVVERFTVKTTATPFAQESVLTADLSATGIRGAGLTDLAPELKEHLNGSQLTDGRFKTHFESHARFDRRGQRDFDFSRPFLTDLAIEGTEFKGSGDGLVLAGLDAFHAEQMRIDPKSGSVVTRTVEITKPQARMIKDAQGIHVLGLVLPPPPAPSTAPAETSVEVATATAPTTASAKPAGEIRIDHLIVSGLDVRVEDQTATPPLIVPLNSLEVEARDLTTLALTEPRTMRFSVLLNADKVPVLVKPRGSGGVIGALGGLANLATGTHNEPTTRQTVDREFFSQIAVSGSMDLYPQPKGVVKTSINGFELGALQGAAAQKGVTLNGGVFDGNIDARFRDDGILDTRSRLVLTDLEIADSPEGLVAKTLNFPAPLDAVVKTLQKADGSIQIPLNVQMRGTSLSLGSVLGAASQALYNVVKDAITNAPVKVVGGAADFVGIGGLLASRKPDEPQPVEIRFSPGSSLIESDARARIATAIEQARKDDKIQLTIRSELGGADATLAERRANPPIADCQALAAELRSRKIELAQQRSVLAGQVRAELAALSPEQSAPSVTQLRALDQRIVDVEDSLDQVYELLRPGAERQAARRMRAAALNVAQARIDAIAAILKSSNLPGIAERVNPIPAQFNPTDADEGGRVIIIPVVKKSQ